MNLPDPALAGFSAVEDIMRSLDTDSILEDAWTAHLFGIETTMLDEMPWLKPEKDEDA